MAERKAEIKQMLPNSLTVYQHFTTFFTFFTINGWCQHVFASGWKTARVRRATFWIWGLGGVGWDINVHVPCVQTWMLRCCYVTGQGLGGVGWDINVHVPCVHTWMLRCCYVTNLVAKASWWQTVPHATLNWPLNTICFMKLAIIERASSASPRKRNGETC